MKKSKILVGIMLAMLTLLFPITSYAAEAPNKKSSETSEYQKVYNEIYSEYSTMDEFQKELKESPQTALSMINYLTKQTLNSNILKADAVRPPEGSAYCFVPAIKQGKSYWCGYATTLQTLYGLNLEDTIDGSTDYDKQSNIMHEMKTVGHSAYVYKIKNFLNIFK